MLTNEFFNSFIGIYRPYIKRTQSILDQFGLHTGQWLVLKDIATYDQTTLVQYLNVVLLKNRLRVKLLKYYLKKIYFWLLQGLTNVKSY